MGTRTHQILTWEYLEQYRTYELILRLTTRSKGIPVATVYSNGVWCTWDKNGVGGENSREQTVGRAKIEAAASAIAQGFI